MNVLVLGSGGREHALAWKISLSAQVKNVFVAPGNPGMSFSESLKQAELSTFDPTHVANYCRENSINLVIIGPENILADGMVDYLQQQNITVFGPTKAAAQLETSKDFAKKIMRDAGVPTAEYKAFTNLNEALNYIKTWPFTDGVAVKVDGLAAGKGVYVCPTLELATQAIADLQANSFAGKLLVEELLIGKEISVFTICQGKEYVHLASACDYKRLKNNDLGPNTGGMGAFGPVSWFTDDLKAEVYDKVIKPVLTTMEKKGTPFSGTLFTGLMVTSAGPKVLEFNTRFGDPETQVLMPLIESDIVNLFYSCATGKLNEFQDKELKFKEKVGVHVVMAAAGYPGTQGEKVQKGDTISINGAIDKNCQLFFAGVSNEEKLFKTNGGRVLGLTALADDIESARALAYSEIKKIKFSGAQWRTDIGLGR